jgi:hypothetical protein
MCCICYSHSFVTPFCLHCRYIEHKVSSINPRTSAGIHHATVLSCCIACPTHLQHSHINGVSMTTNSDFTSWGMLTSKLVTLLHYLGSTQFESKPQNWLPESQWCEVNMNLSWSPNRHTPVFCKSCPRAMTDSVWQLKHETASGSVLHSMAKQE